MKARLEQSFTTVFSDVLFSARKFGCLLQFYETGELGVNVNDQMSVILEIEHASHANICTLNDGLKSLEIKVGYKF